MATYEKNDERLQDFGEHISGAKKETYFRDLDLSDEKTRTLPLSKLWNKKEIDKIENKEIAAIAYILRDNLPNKPRKGHKLNRWFEELQKAQGTVKLLTDPQSTIDPKDVIKQLQETNIGDKIYLLSKIDKKDWGSIGYVDIHSDLNKENYTFEVVIGLQKHFLDTSVSNDGYANLTADKKQMVIDSAFDKFQQKLEEYQVQDKSTKSYAVSDFDIYSRRADGSVFISAKADRQHTPLVDNFESVTQARDYLREHTDELGKTWEEYKVFNSITKSDMRNPTNETRIGQNYRDHDITPDDFMATFGVRGGQFGNWVNSDERQKMLNSAYDGFMDLSKALNIKPEAIGLNGKLGIAFGARGSGTASAHYECSEAVINLTKTRGAGSLAHEWWHALDHYMSNDDNLLSVKLTKQNVKHEELVAPVQALMAEIKNSPLYERSKNADTYRTAYFGTNEEMSARAFEAFIKQELSEKGIKNDFLVNVRSFDNWHKNQDAYPYPTADEIKVLAKSYTQVFDALKDVDKKFVAENYEPEHIHTDTLAASKDEQKEQQQNRLDGLNSELSYPIGQNHNEEKVAAEQADLEVNTVAEQQISAETKEPTPNIAQNRTDINCPYHQKNEAKALGAKWDGNNKTWYIPAGLDLDKFSKWLPQERQPNEKQEFQGDETKIAQEYTPINVPYTEKNEAKALGAKWDNANKTWYVPAGEDLNKFERWADKKEVEAKQGQLNQNKDRIYLYTQPSDNPVMQELKARGIVKFDKPNKLWYAHKENLDSVRHWTTRPHVPTPQQALAEHLHSLGIKVEAGHPIFDSRPHRLSNDGSNQKNVMYQAYLNDHINGVPYARITNFSRDGIAQGWTYPIEHLNALKTIEAVDMATNTKSYNQNHQTTQTEPRPQSLPQAPHPQQDEAKIALENKMAERAKMLMSFVPLADNSQNYLAKKQIGNNGVAHIVPSSDNIPAHLQDHIVIGNTPKQYFWLQANNPDDKLVLQRGSLVIPQTNAQGEIRAFETIAYNGRKYALKDAEKSGLSTTLGSPKDGEPIIVAEGYATGATLHEQTGRTVVVAFGKGGLMDISQQLRQNYPNSKIYIGADNDHNKEQNYGLINAQAVQKAVKNVYILTPNFDKGDTGKDWNDIYVDKGLEIFKQQIKAELVKINSQPQQVQQSQSSQQLPQQPINKIMENNAREPRQQHTQHHLDPDILRQNYPNMSDDNIKAVQMWRIDIANRYPNDPMRQEASLARLTNKLSDYANGEILPSPKPYQAEQSAPVKQEQAELDNKGKGR